MIEYLYRKDLFYSNSNVTTIDKLPVSISNHTEHKAAYLSNSPLHLFNVLDGLRKLNIFIGSNNSGKSRFMRRLFTVDSHESLSYLSGIEQYRELIEEYFENAAPFFSEEHNHQNHLDVLGIEARDYLYSVFTILAFTTPVENIFTSMQGPIASQTLKRLCGRERDSAINFANALNTKYPHIPPGFTPSPQGLMSSLTVKSTYIPILRGVRNITGNDDDIYATKTQHDYRLDSNYYTGLTILTGHSLNAEFTEYLLGDHDKRALFRSFEQFLSENFFDGQPLSIIPSNKADKHITLKIGERADRKIHELGDGLQSIIIFSWALFHASAEPTIIFIEEPENNMHPGLLRKFFEAFITNPAFEKVQIVATSHSNHLIDLMHEHDSVSLFRFTEAAPPEDVPNFNPIFHVEKVVGDDRCLLDQLGVRYSSVLLTNCVLMVEGIGDRMIISRLLKAYMDYKRRTDDTFKVYNENSHYAFLEYAGSNITHYAFSDNEVDTLIRFNKINANTFVLADGDGFFEDNGAFHAVPGAKPPQKNKGTRFEQLRSELGQRFQILPSREVENLIPPAIMIQALKELNRHALKGPSPSDDALFFRVGWESYRHKQIGRYLETHFLTPIGQDTLRAVKNSAGSMANKAEFAHAASKFISADTITQFDASVLSLLDLMYHQIKGFNS